MAAVVTAVVGDLAVDIQGKSHLWLEGPADGVVELRASELLIEIFEVSRTDTLYRTLARK
jgi:hypothetical protein